MCVFVQCSVKPLVNKKYNRSECKPPHDSRECAKAVSVSYCASIDESPEERLEIYGNLARGVVSARSKRTHNLQVNRNGVIK